MLAAICEKEPLRSKHIIISGPYYALVEDMLAFDLGQGGREAFLFRRASKISLVSWFMFENPDSYETICGDRFGVTATRPTFRNKGGNGGHDSIPPSVPDDWNILDEARDWLHRCRN